MLQNNITIFLQYCKNSDFADRSIESLRRRLAEFNKFISSSPVSAVSKIDFQRLTLFVADYNEPSVHVKKARIWALRQFFHYLKLQQLINDNIALQLPYPNIERKVPQFLTIAEFKLILSHFVQHATTPIGLRNLVMIALLGFLGLRTAAIVALNIDDIDLADLCWDTKISKTPINTLISIPISMPGT
jgi:integrase/recombinase XerC